MNKRLATTIIGLICVCSGMVLIFQGALALYGAEINSIFGAIISDAPTQKIAAISCPAEWAENKAGRVTATVQNPLDKPMGYSFRISTYPDALTSDNQPPQNMRIPAKQTATVSWNIDPGYATSYYLNAIVFAYSDEDLAKPQFHAWPSSYKGTCAVRLENNQAFTWLRVRAVGGLIAVIVGVVLVYFTRRPFSRRQTVVAGLVGVVIVVVAGIALLNIFAASG